MGCTKKQFMEIVYSKEELRRIDSAIPQEFWGAFDTFSHVMNYNEKTVFGDLEDMYAVALHRKIELPQELLNNKNQKRKAL